MNNKVIIILGPTGIGKSDLSIELAEELNGEIISADSIQIYKGLNIGSGKITEEEKKGIPHYMIDFLSPSEEYSVEQYVNDTKKYIKVILSKGKLPIIVGGTGLYLKALINNYDFSNTPKNEEIRNKYEELAKINGLDYIYNILKSKDKNKAEKINPNDKKRIIRALEICENNSIQKNCCDKNKNEFDFYVFALNLDREKLYGRINKRVDKMFKSGLEKEVKNLYDQGLNEKFQSMKGIGYKEFFPYFEGQISLEDVIDKIKQHSRNYAKRQLTWLRSMEVIWIDMEDIKIAKQLIKEKILNNKM